MREGRLPEITVQAYKENETQRFQPRHHSALGTRLPGRQTGQDRLRDPPETALDTTLASPRATAQPPLSASLSQPPLSHEPLGFTAEYHGQPDRVSRARMTTSSASPSRARRPAQCRADSSRQTHHHIHRRPRRLRHSHAATERSLRHVHYLVPPALAQVASRPRAIDDIPVHTIAAKNTCNTLGPAFALCGDSMAPESNMERTHRYRECKCMGS